MAACIAGMSAACHSYPLADVDHLLAHRPTSRPQLGERVTRPVLRGVLPEARDRQIAAICLPIQCYTGISSCRGASIAAQDALMLASAFCGLADGYGRGKKLYYRGVFKGDRQPRGIARYPALHCRPGCREHEQRRKRNTGCEVLRKCTKGHGVNRAPHSKERTCDS
jgi:hypothetical protein